MNNTKAFETFRIGPVRFLAFPIDGGVYIMDESGNGYGSYFTVKSFMKSNPRARFKAVEPICRVKLSHQIVG